MHLMLLPVTLLFTSKAKNTYKNVHLVKNVGTNIKLQMLLQNELTTIVEKNSRCVAQNPIVKSLYLSSFLVLSSCNREKKLG